MVKIRLTPLSRREFQKDVYRPGVISLTRLAWGSIGGGLYFCIIAILSQLTGIGVLYPPLAASCFILASCVFLRVARPKSVIVGHFISAIGGVMGVLLANLIFLGTDLLIPMKLGFAVMFASVFMQILDADHPPAAATAAIPALFPIIPRPCVDFVLPLHMVWGAVIIVVFGVLWNRLWFEWPVDDGHNNLTWFNLNMDQPDLLGTIICIGGFIFMCFKSLSEEIYILGLWITLIGVCVLSFHHFFTSSIISTENNENR